MLNIAVLDWLIFCPILKSEHLLCEWGRKTGQDFALFDPPVKNRGGLVEIRIIRAPHKF